MNRYTFIGFLQGLAVLPIIATLATALGSFHWLLDILTSFHLQYAIALLLFGLPLLLLRRFVIAGIVGLTLVWNGVLLAPYYWPISTVQQAQGESLRLLSFNVHTGNPDHVRTLQYLQGEQADVILLLEVNEAWVRDLALLTTAYPYHLDAPRQDNFGIALYSRVPMTAEVAVFGQAMPSISMTLALSSTEVHLIGTHPLPPTGPNYARLRNRQIAAIADVIAQSSGPSIVAGDLNASAWSAAMNPLVAVAGLRDAALGFGATPTWFAMRQMVSAPIDHVLVSPSVAVTAWRVGSDLGSDHRPVVATLSIRPS